MKISKRNFHQNFKSVKVKFTLILDLVNLLSDNRTQGFNNSPTTLQQKLLEHLGEFVLRCDEATRSLHLGLVKRL